MFLHLDNHLLRLFSFFLWKQKLFNYHGLILNGFKFILRNFKLFKIILIVNLTNLGVLKVIYILMNFKVLQKVK